MAAFTKISSSIIRSSDERLYDAELNEKYGQDAISASNCRIKEMTFERYAEAEQLEAEVEVALAVALQNGNPADALAQKACALHEKWLRIYYPQYTKEYHREMGNLYVADERFATYYDKIQLITKQKNFAFYILFIFEPT